MRSSAQARFTAVGLVARSSVTTSLSRDRKASLPVEMAWREARARA